MKERTWLGILLSFAAPCRGKMAGSVVLAILSVAGGFVPYLGVYQIIRLFLERQADWEGIVFWCGVCLAGYAVKVAGYALSTMLAHVSAYTILEGLRLQVADRLMGAPLGEVESRPIGSMTESLLVGQRIRVIQPPAGDIFKGAQMWFSSKRPKAADERFHLVRGWRRRDWEIGRAHV